MSTPLTHLQQQQANKDLAQYLGVVSLPSSGQLDDAVPQWRLVLLFDAAVHHVDEQLAAKGYPVLNTHAPRKRRIRQAWAHVPSVTADYEQLELRSREARYEGWVPDASDLSAAATTLVNLEQQLG